MKKLWQDIRGHRRAAVLYLAYWLATLTVIPVTWHGGIPVPVVALLVTNCLIAGALVGWWRRPNPERATRPRDRIWGGMLAGVLSAEITLLVMKGGVCDEAIGWLNGRRFQGDEILGFVIAVGIIGDFLNLIGAACAVVLSQRDPST